jgi:plasmid stability protein
MEPAVAQLTVRRVDDRIVRALRDRAARAGRSAEAEHRRILEEVLGGGNAGIFEELRSRRIRLPPGARSTTDLLRSDRERNEVPTE